MMNESSKKDMLIALAAKNHLQEQGGILIYDPCHVLIFVGTAPNNNSKARRSLHLKLMDAENGQLASRASHRQLTKAKLTADR